MTTEKVRARNISLEWFRILAMMMIVLLHSIDHSGLAEALIPGSVLYYYEMFIYALVQVCVNCFVLLSGYFLVTSTFKTKKLLSLWIEVVFYSLSIKLVMMVTGEIPFSFKSLLSCLVPVITGRYWFVTIYFGMYLLSPFYNIAITAMTKKQHGILMILLMLLSSGLVSIHPSLKGMNSGAGWGLAWFTVLYIVAAYFRLHYVPTQKPIKALVVFLVCPILMLSTFVASEKLGVPIIAEIVENWWRYDSVWAFVSSLALLIFFLNWNISVGQCWNRLITRISGATFGVYLIHAHANICTESKWQALGMVDNMAHWWFPFYQVMIVGAIFFACVLIDWVRQMVFNTIRLSVLVDSISVKIEEYFKRTVSHMSNTF